jgi:hypothetical protein
MMVSSNNPSTKGLIMNTILHATAREVTKILTDGISTENLGTNQKAAVKGAIKAFVEPVSILQEGSCQGFNTEMAQFHLLQAQTFFGRAVEVEWNGGKNLR